MDRFSKASMFGCLAWIASHAGLLASTPAHDPMAVSVEELPQIATAAALGDSDARCGFGITSRTWRRKNRTPSSGFDLQRNRAIVAAKSSSPSTSSMSKVTVGTSFGSGRPTEMRIALDGPPIGSKRATLRLQRPILTK